MEKWTKAIIVCMGLLTIASKAESIQISSSNFDKSTNTSYEQLVLNQ